MLRITMLTTVPLSPIPASVPSEKTCRKLLACARLSITSLRPPVVLHIAGGGAR